MANTARTGWGHLPLVQSGTRALALLPGRPLAPEVTAPVTTGTAEEGSAVRVPTETPAVSKSGARGAQPRGSRRLRLVPVLLEFGVHHFEGGQEVAQEEDQERDCQHEHLAGQNSEGKEEQAVPALPAGVPPHPRPENP